MGLAGNKGAAGAKISIYAAGTNQLLWYEQVATYDFQVATSYYGYGETERHFGLGSRATVDVVVEFPGSGRVTRINNVAANQTIRVLESAGSVPLDGGAGGRHRRIVERQSSALGAPHDPISIQLVSANAPEGEVNRNHGHQDDVLKKAAVSTANRFSSPGQEIDSRLVDELFANGIEPFDMLAKLVC